MLTYADRVRIFRDGLLRMQTGTPEELGASRDLLLVRLIDHARHVAFYRDRLPAPTEALSDAWRSIPVLRRSDVQWHLQSLTATRLPPGRGTVSKSQTSGSTGRPLTFSHEEALDLASVAQTERLFTIWKLDGAKSLATFLSMYDDPEKRGIRRHGWRVGFPDGVREILEVSNDIGAQLDWLKAVGVDYLFVRGGMHLEELARLALARGETLRFEKILSGGSVLSKRAIGLADRAFRSKVIDIYGAAETGMIGYTCPDCRLLHTCDETMLVEVLREDGSECAPGEIGRVVVTVLHSYATPVIRYEIGDYAIRGPRARCGRPFGSLGEITGRYRGCFVMRDGRIIHPYANARRIGEHLSYQQIQLVQTEYERVELRYVPANRDAQVNKSALEALFRQAMPDVVLELVPVESLPLDRNGKFEETLSLVPRQDAGVSGDQPS